MKPFLLLVFAAFLLLPVAAAKDGNGARPESEQLPKAPPRDGPHEVRDPKARAEAPVAQLRTEDGEGERQAKHAALDEKRAPTEAPKSMRVDAELVPPVLDATSSSSTGLERETRAGGPELGPDRGSEPRRGHEGEPSRHAALPATASSESIPDGPESLRVEPLTDPAASIVPEPLPAPMTPWTQIPLPLGPLSDLIPHPSPAAAEEFLTRIRSSLGNQTTTPPVAAESYVPATPGNAASWTAWILGALFGLGMGGGTIRALMRPRRSLAKRIQGARAAAAPVAPAVSRLGIQALMMRVEKVPGDADACFALATQLLLQGLHDSGLRYLDRSLRLNPLHVVRLLQDGELAPIRANPEVRAMLRRMKTDYDRRAWTGYA